MCIWFNIQFASAYLQDWTLVQIDCIEIPSQWTLQTISNIYAAKSAKKRNEFLGDHFSFSQTDAPVGIMFWTLQVLHLLKALVRANLVYAKTSQHQPEVRQHIKVSTAA